jgi:hypothetical protein
MFILILNGFFTTHFLKMVPIHVRFSPGFPPGAGFPERNLLLHASRTLEELLSRGEFPAKASLAWFAVRRGVLQRISSATLEPRRTGFSPHVVSSDEIAPREILLLEEIPGLRAHGLAPLLKRAL